VSAEATGRASVGTRVFDHQDVPAAANVTSTELRNVLDRQRFPLVVFRPDDGEILLANPAAAEILGRDLNQVIGSHTLDLVEPGSNVELASKSLATGAVDAYRARRRLIGHEDEVVYVWTRAIDVDDTRLAVAVLALGTQLPLLGGAELGSPFGASIPIVVGIIDSAQTVVRMSADLKEIAGTSASEARGKPLSDLFAPGDARRVRDLVRSEPTKPITLSPVALREPSENAPDFCLLVGEPGGDRGKRLFALVGWPRAEHSAVTPRERELEARLRRISAEVRAAGLIEILGDYPGSEPSELGEELTTRQLEIVELLLRGVRVPTIAKTLYISPSTVRNHLSQIYRRYNVHSQAELLEKLRKTSAQSE
jgi:DNA-binding CsgD family transcriptional regulator/PAS domain-containing protein